MPLYEERDEVQRADVPAVIDELNEAWISAELCCPKNDLKPCCHHQCAAFVPSHAERRGFGNLDFFTVFAPICLLIRPHVTASANITLDNYASDTPLRIGGVLELCTNHDDPLRVEGDVTLGNTYPDEPLEIKVALGEGDVDDESTDDEGDGEDADLDGGMDS